MEQQRAHEQCAANARFADEFLGLFANRGDLVFRDAAMPVRSGDHSQRAVFCVAWVKVQADGEHVFEDAGGRLDMEDVCFDRPRTEAFGFDAFLNGDHYVLVPGNFPVGIRDFVEEDAADGEGFCAENWLDQRANRGGVGEFADLG